MQRGSPPACIFGRLPLLRLACFCRRQRLGCAAKHASLHRPQTRFGVLAPGLRPRPCRGSELLTAPSGLRCGELSTETMPIEGKTWPMAGGDSFQIYAAWAWRRSCRHRAPVKGRGRRPGVTSVGGWVGKNNPHGQAAKFMASHTPCSVKAERAVCGLEPPDKGARLQAVGALLRVVGCAAEALPAADAARRSRGSGGFLLRPLDAVAAAAFAYFSSRKVRETSCRPWGVRKTDRISWRRAGSGGHS